MDPNSEVSSRVLSDKVFIVRGPAAAEITPMGLGAFTGHLIPSRGGKRGVPSEVRSVAVPGGDRNSPCPCGCGKKRKKCPNGGITGIEGKLFEMVPPAHTLTPGQYAEEVYQSLLGRVGEDHAHWLMRTYGSSHVMLYHNDEMIRPERCADLVLEMLSYDDPNHPILDLVDKSCESAGGVAVP